MYRDDSLYMFTTDLYYSCNPCIGAPIVPFCDFLNYTGHSFIGQFFIHVTAVYNHNNIESIFTDSIFNYGIALEIKEKSGSMILSISNIMQDNSFITFEVSNPIESGLLTISDLLGDIKINAVLKNQEIIKIDISKINSGFYLQNLKTNKTNLTKKILINK
jgi:hypothetical protein